ncbi:MAG: hypothetical protein QM808_03805 [Steroidobacteraceae bacterium]
MSVEEALAEIEDFYAGTVTKLVLWDISAATMTALDADDMSRISAAVARHAKLRAGGKSAVVAATDLTFGFSRMYQAYREMNHVTLPYKSFRTRDEAIQWLCSDSTT